MSTQKITKDALSQPGARSCTNAASIAKRSRAPRASTNKTNWTKLRRRTPAQIRQAIAADPEAHATDAIFWKHAKVVLPIPKTIVTMRLDADLLKWFRQHPGYQTRINAILRSYMQAHTKVSQTEVTAG
jgi:uncharacterized protein (DUF4415 family)